MSKNRDELTLRIGKLMEQMDQLEYEGKTSTPEYWKVSAEITRLNQELNPHGDEGLTLDD